MLVTKVVVLVLSALFAALLIMDLLVMWELYVFTFLRGASMAFDQPARRAIIPSIVPHNLVTNAVALTMGSVQVMRIAGAAAAGLIIGLGSTSAAFATVVFLYAGAVIFTWFLNVPDHERQVYRGIRHIVTDFNESIRFAWGNATIRGVLIIGIGYAIFGMAFMQVFAPLFAKQVLDIGDVGFGYLMSITGLGGLIGALVLAFLNPSKYRGLMMLAMMAVSGLLFIGLAGVTYLGSLPLVFIMALLMGTTQSGLFPLTNAILIEVSPDQIRGRVIGLLSMDRAMAALGGALAGFLAAAVGSQLAQIIFGSGCVAVAVVMFVTYPRLRQIQ
ncbi:MAG: MFS family permease [Chloroflexi bacterium]|jgi:MFS family permease|nr:MAG: MFS family permease [Chloroflexota bacterium]